MELSDRNSKIQNSSLSDFLQNFQKCKMRRVGPGVSPARIGDPRGGDPQGCLGKGSEVEVLPIRDLGQ